MGAAERANNQRRDDDQEKVARLAGEVLDLIDQRARDIGVDCRRVTVTFDTRASDERRVLASVYAGPPEDDAATEVSLMLRALESVAVDRYGILRKTLAECILGKNVTLEFVPPPAPGGHGQPDPRRPSRNRGQRRRGR